MKHIWILEYYNQKGFVVKTFYFTSEKKAINFAFKNKMPLTATTWKEFPVEIL